ncbi:MAG: hypothetical protein KAS62_00310, partial [Candidatus Delongbacteria bacterium]|nr:hypothetical protein [Candidatus Delongbacteria bacterium]
MKKLVLVLLILGSVLFAESGKGFEVDYQLISDNQMKLDFKTDFTISVIEKNGVIYSSINGAGSVMTNEKGFAELPKLNATLQIGDENDVTVASLDGDYTELQLDYPLLPSRGTIYRNQNPETIPYETDPKSVIDAWYPQDLTESTNPFIFRDVRGVNIYAFPIQYNAAKQTIRVYKNLTVEVKED